MYNIREIRGSKTIQTELLSLQDFIRKQDQCFQWIESNMATPYIRSLHISDYGLFLSKIKYIQSKYFIDSI